CRRPRFSTTAYRDYWFPEASRRDRGPARCTSRGGSFATEEQRGLTPQVAVMCDAFYGPNGKAGMRPEVHAALQKSQARLAAQRKAIEAAARPASMSANRSHAPAAAEVLPRTR